MKYIDLEEFEKLAEIIKTSQGIKFDLITRFENEKLHIIPNCRSNDINYPNIVIREEHQTLVLSNIVMYIEGLGTGTLVMEWLMGYCKQRQIQYFKVSSVGHDREAMKHICEKFNMERKEGNDCYDYTLSVLD